MTDESQPLEATPEEAPAAPEEKAEVVVLEDQASGEEEAQEKSKRKFTLTPLTFLLGGVVGAILLALLVHFGLTPLLANQSAQEALDSSKNASGPVTPVNTAMVTFQGQKVQNANVQQKGLGGGEQVTTPAAFIFSNGKASKGRRVVDVYLDFSNQRSRDFLLLNQNNLRGLIESGSAELRLHPVPTGNAFTMYSSEALAESFVTSPDASWAFLFQLMRLSATLKTDSSDEVVNAIVDTAKAEGVKDVDAASIKNGTFASWILSVGNDPHLKAGYYPPLIYVNDKLLDGNSLNLNDADTLRREIMKR